MKSPHLQRTTLLVGLVLAAGTTGVLACQGSRKMKDGHEFFIGLTSPQTVVVPRRGEVRIPIEPVVYLQSWSLEAKTSRIRLTLELPQTGGLPPLKLGPLEVPDPPIRDTASPIKYRVEFVLPVAKLSNVALPALGKVVATGNVTFAAGSGGAALSCVDETRISLVQPAGVKRNLAQSPLVDVRALAVGEDDVYGSVSQGDQGLLRFLVVNNDARRSLSATLTCTGRSVSRLPPGLSREAAYAGRIYSSGPPSGAGGVLAAAFRDDLGPGEWAPEVAPSPDGKISRPISVPALGAQVVEIAVRAHPDCGYLHSNVRDLLLQGTFSDGKPALGFASRLLIVGSRTNYPVLRVSDTATAEQRSDTLWTPARYRDSLGRLIAPTTLDIGNRPLSEDENTRLAGPHLWPELSAYDFSRPDSIGLTEPPAEASYEVWSARLPNLGQVAHNRVRVTNLAIAEGTAGGIPVVAPSPYHPGTLLVNVRCDGFDPHIEILDARDNSVLFSGTRSQFTTSTPSHLLMFRGVRTLRLVTSAYGRAIVDARAPTAVTPVTAKQARTVEIAVPLRFASLGGGADPGNHAKRWWARIITASSGVIPVVTDGTVADTLRFRLDPKLLAPIPATNVLTLNLQVDGTASDETVVVAVRYKKPQARRR